MAVKPYPQTEEKPTVFEEPAVAYQCTDPMTHRDVFSVGTIDENDDEAFEAMMTAAFCEQGDCSRPFTWDEARQWIAEAEEEIAAGRVVSHEEVMREMRELILSYEN